MKRKNKLLKKQLWKYFTVIVVAIASISAYSLFIGLSTVSKTWILITSSAIIGALLIFDIASIKDAIPILKG